MDREGKPVRLVFVRSLKEKEPESFLLENLDYKSPQAVRNEGVTILFPRKSEGQIPVLCFHRIGDEELYELSLPRVHHLMASLIKYQYYPISDLEFANGDFSSVPSGMRPVVLGADDAGATQLLWDEDTLAAYGRGNPNRWELDPDCLASIFTRYFQKTKGHYNLTFYISFDAVPFRQLGGLANPGFPYEGTPVVRDKIRYAMREFHLGHHSLTHTFRENLTHDAFLWEIRESNRILSDYVGQKIALPTLAYPYGSGNFTKKEESDLLSSIERGEFPKTAYDLDGRFSDPPWSPSFRSWNISRYSVENKSFEPLLARLSSNNTYLSHRTILIYSTGKAINLEDYNLNLGGDDTVYVYIP
jgi:peptidoglycan/xylan/chitin deacetylase (PgdA/CDA1 family)